MKFGLKRKITVLAVIVAFIPLGLILVLISRFDNDVVQQSNVEINALSKHNIEQIVRDAYGLCETANNIIQQRLEFTQKSTQYFINSEGGFKLNAGQVQWNAENQYTHETIPIALPQLYLGNTWTGQNFDFNVKSVFVDRIRENSGLYCTVFQRMNEAGDMLRVATSIEKSSKIRAISTYMPALMPNGGQNKIIQTVLSGKVYKGFTNTFGQWFITYLLPIKDASGQIIGMLFLGDKVESFSSIHKSLQNIKVGNTGYVYVLGTLADLKGKYIVSKNGERDGEDILMSRDAEGKLFIQNVINSGLKLNPNEVAFEKYKWRNPGEEKPREKVVALMYFREWGWVIGASAYVDEFYESSERISSVVGGLRNKLLVVGIIGIIISIFMAMYVANRLTLPISLLNKMAKKVAKGYISEVKEEIALYKEEENYKTITSKIINFVKSQDETRELIKSFSKMIDNLYSLIGQVQLSGIQVNSSTVQIAASAHELESTVAQQAAATKEVSITSRQISSTSDELVSSMLQVAMSVSDATTLAENGKSDLLRMENVMEGLSQSTVSISTKLSIINDKASKITTVITTINKISDQTDLLALNAAIEAEKAGEYGKGFSVVSREISRLADQTANATRDIEFMVREMQSSVRAGVVEIDRFSSEVSKGVNEVETIGLQLSAIIDQVNSLLPQFKSIEDGIQAQSMGARQISDAMNQLAQTAEHTKDSLQDFKRVTDNLNTAVKELKQEISLFKINTD